MILRLACLLLCGCGEVASPVDAVGVDGAVDATSLDAAPTTVTLTIARSGDGTGRVLSNPDGLDCGPTCAHDFPGGTDVKLTATADTGSIFAGWEAVDCVTLDPCAVTLVSPTTVTAKFSLVQ